MNWSNNRIVSQKFSKQFVKKNLTKKVFRKSEPSDLENTCFVHQYFFATHILRTLPYILHYEQSFFPNHSKTKTKRKKSFKLSAKVV